VIKYLNAKEEFEEAFGFPVENLTERQLWVLVKLMKHARGRCRNNAAMNNYLNSTFVGHMFRDVPKIDERTQETYKGLEITKK